MFTTRGWPLGLLFYFNPHTIAGTPYPLHLLRLFNPHRFYFSDAHGYDRPAGTLMTPVGFPVFFAFEVSCFYHFVSFVLKTGF